MSVTRTAASPKLSPEAWWEAARRTPGDAAPGRSGEKSAQDALALLLARAPRLSRIHEGLTPDRGDRA
ncbi:MAG: hypothetical protein ACFBSD_12035 [Paracoccaceae bacterium]